MNDATAATSLGRQAREEGDFPAARQHYANAARVYREADDLLAYAHTLRHIADVYRQKRNSKDAKPLYEDALELYRSDLNTKLLDLANTVRPYALLLEEEGEAEAARQYLGRGRESLWFAPNRRRGLRMPDSSDTTQRPLNR
jgi:tetratricopeptide (TPR) repeat protein